jgi:hypothetical protein
VAPLHFVACGAPSYFAARGLPLSVTDLSKHNCLRLRGHGASHSAPWRLGPQKSAESLSISGNFLANDIPALVTTRCTVRAGVRSPPLCSSLVSNGRPEADLAGVRLSAHTYLHSLREPQASCRAREGFREFHARATSQQSRPVVGPADVAGTVRHLPVLRITTHSHWGDWVSASCICSRQMAGRTRRLRGHNAGRTRSRTILRSSASGILPRTDRPGLQLAIGGIPHAGVSGHDQACWRPRLP